MQETDPKQKNNVLEAREKMKEKYSEVARTGGKGSQRRKKKVVHKSLASDDKRLKTILTKLQATPLPGIEAVNLFKDDGTITHFKNPERTFPPSNNLPQASLTKIYFER